jgi:hypothetical protein
VTFDEVLAQVCELLRREGRVSYRALRRRFDLDEEYLEDVKAEIIQAKRLAMDEEGAVLVWTGDAATAEVPLALLQAIAEASEEALHRGLAQLQAAEFLYETHLFPERAYTFKHALTHEVAYGGLLQERRRPRAMPSWGRSRRAAPSGTKGSGLPKRLITPRVSWWPPGGLGYCAFINATCAERSPCSNALLVSVRK